jgi:L-lactate dehydrogenase complex protein LldG
MSGDARSVVLARVRAALADGARPLVEEDEGGDARSAALSHADLVARFAERVADYRATVVRVPGDAGAIAAAVAAACARHGARRLLVPAGLPAEWLTDAIEPLRDDPPLEHAALGAADGAITSCALAIAETGTIVLDTGPGQGRRALTLLPDLHVCVVEAARVVDGVAEAIAALHPGPGAALAPITFVSGPSATSDIELDRVEGVHGPRRLEVVVAG